MQAYSNQTNLGLFSIAGAIEAASADTSLSNYGFRSYSSIGSLEIGSLYSQPIDLRALGTGGWYLGSSGSGVNGNIAAGVYAGTSLTAGSGNVYRLGSGGANLWITNPVLNNNSRGAAALEVGMGLVNGNGGNPGNATGIVILDGNNAYSGVTTVNRGSTLRLRGVSNSSTLEVFGQLSLEGTNGTLVGTTTGLNLRPGSVLFLNNDLAGFVTNSNGRIGDSATVSLNNATLQLIGTLPVDTVERIGAISFTGGSELVMQTVQSGRIAELVLTGATPFVRNGQATLLITSSNAGHMGSNERLSVTGAAAWSRPMSGPS